MMRGIWWKSPALAGMFVLAACGGPVDEPSDDTTEEVTQDGVGKSFDGKSDAWNWRNDPAGFRTELDYLFENLPSEGAADRVAWAASYWPYYQDGINHRWQGQDELSPAEKWDKAFGGWEPADGFMELTPWNNYTCEFDPEYYEGLGPAASWTHRNKGTWLATNGIDDDGDGVDDADECREDSSEFDGLETWWGICHAWAPAAIMEDEPMRAVERNGVTFDVSDIKALLMQQYDRTSAHLVGGRCNDRELERDDTGRVISSECRDLNAGSWHVIVTNFLGKHSRPFIIERTAAYQVWNQPLVGYQITEQREISLDEAHALLNITPEEAGGTGEFVHDVEEGTYLGLAILDFVNTAALQTLDDDARLDRRAAENIFRERPFQTLAELDQVSYVGPSAFDRLVTYVEENDLVEQPGYQYNEDATRFVEIRMTTDWITESHPSTSPQTPNDGQYTRHDRYHYILELNDLGEVLGGEWVGSSILTHPDFVWLPTAARGGNPHLDIDEIRDMIRESREGLDDDDDDTDDNGGNGAVRSYTNTDAAEIPDNDPNGVTSVLSVSDEGTVKSVRLDLEIEHTYRGDLVVQLAHAGTVVTVYDGMDAGSPWTDDVSLSGQEVEGFLGAPLDGEWELRVFDTMSADVGRLVQWTVHAEVD